MARRSTHREKVTFAVPSYLLELADLQAEALGVDRYDVIRMAIGQGLMVLRLNEQLQKNPQRYIEELRALTNDEPGAYTKLTDKLGDGVVEEVQTQVEKKRKKA